MNGLMILENDAARAMMKLHPSQMYLSSNAPETGTDMVLPKQAAVNLAAFMGLV